MLGKVKKKIEAVPLELKVSVSYAVCSIFQRCLSFITLPLFTRLLTKAQYGQYTLYSSWLGIFSLLLTLNLAYGSFSSAMIKYEDRRDEYISAIQGICVTLVAVFLAVYVPTRGLWNRIFELPTTIVIVMVMEILTATAIQLWSGKKRFEFKYKSVIGVTLLTSILSPIIAFVFVINSQERGYARILGYAIVTIVIGACFFALNISRGRKFFSKDLWLYALRFNIPLLAYYLSQVIFNQSDRIMINHICGAEDAAMYGVAYNFAMILTFVLNSINNSYVPWFYGKIRDGKLEDNKQVACAIAIIMAVLLLGIIWFAPEIILIMAGEAYMEAIWVVPPIAISLLLLFYAQLFINVEFYFEEKRSLVRASIGAAVLNIVLNAILIPRFGFVVAGYTTLLSYVVFAWSNYRSMKKIVQIHDVKKMYDIPRLVGISVLFVAASFGGEMLYAWPNLRIAIFLVCGVLLLTQYKKFMGALSLLGKGKK